MLIKKSLETIAIRLLKDLRPGKGKDKKDKSFGKSDKISLNHNTFCFEISI